jgi:hypothetical protein
MVIQQLIQDQIDKGAKSSLYQDEMDIQGIMATDVTIFILVFILMEKRLTSNLHTGPQWITICVGRGNLRCRISSNVSRSGREMGPPLRSIDTWRNMVSRHRPSGRGIGT